jgi:hypothetical protein
MKSKVYIENLLRYPEISIKLLENIKFNNHHKIIDLKSQCLGLRYRDKRGAFKSFTAM